MKNKLDSFDLREIIGYSIEAEEKSRKFYKKFVEAGKGELIPERFRSLMKDEKAHKKALIDLHEEIYGNRDYPHLDDDLPPHEDFENLENVENLIDALEKAINNEYNAIRVYEYLAEEYKEHSDFFEYLAVMEHGHQESLSKEKELYERNYEKEDNRSLSEEVWKSLGLKGI